MAPAVPVAVVSALTSPAAAAVAAAAAAAEALRAHEEEEEHKEVDEVEVCGCALPGCDVGADPGVLEAPQLRGAREEDPEACLCAHVVG